jgi:hypothetical protein
MSVRRSPTFALIHAGTSVPDMVWGRMVSDQPMTASRPTLRPRRPHGEHRLFCLGHVATDGVGAHRLLQSVCQEEG